MASGLLLELCLILECVSSCKTTSVSMDPEYDREREQDRVVDLRSIRRVAVGLASRADR